MAIRPADLQLAYQATPQNAAVVANAQNAPQVAQQASAAAFAAQSKLREESIEQTTHVEGSIVRPNGERESGGHGGGARQQRRRTPQDQTDAAPAGFAGDGEHLIDFTA